MLGSPTLLRYTQLFNVRDWNGIRAMLADDVKLDVISRSKAAGRRAIGTYFTGYERIAGWRMAPAWLEGSEVVAVYTVPDSERASYFVDVSFIQADSGLPIEMRQSKHLNNIVEHDHRVFKRITRPILGFKTFRCAAILLADIEVMHMIRKGQLANVKDQASSLADQFYSLAFSYKSASRPSLASSRYCDRAALRSSPVIDTEVVSIIQSFSPAGYAD